MRPLTDERPKPMVEIVGTPLISRLIRQLASSGIDEIYLTLGYRGEQISRYVGDGAAYDVKIFSETEEKPLGTAGAVRQILEKHCFDEDFFVISGDAYTEIDLKALYDFHRSKGGIGTLAVKRVADPHGFGLVKTEIGGLIRDFEEKPQNPTTDLVNMGIYVFRPVIREAISRGFCDFARDVLPAFIGSIYAYETDAYWSDIGTLESYYKTNLYVVSKRQEAPAVQ